MGDVPYKAIFENAAIGIAFVDPDGRFVRVNPALCKMLGYSEQEMIGLGLKDLTHPDDLQRNAKLYLELVCGERDSYSIENRYVRKDGSTLWGKLTASSVHDDGGHFLHSVDMIENISEKKEVEDRLMRSMTDLKRSNQDLEHFAYAISHDFQTQLRHIEGFTKLLDAEYGQHFDKTAREYMDYVISGASKVKEMMTDLLSVSRAGRDLNVAKFPLDHALDDALLILETDINEKEVEIERDTLPVVQADKSLFIRVFLNLVGNAIKFRHPDREPMVRISSTDEGDEWHVSVKDNGLGMNMRYSERIFVIFQRLPGTRKNGTGIGLALCKKIIERHRGRIWAESVQGEGSTFHFTLPKEYKNGTEHHTGETSRDPLGRGRPSGRRAHGEGPQLGPSSVQLASSRNR